MQEREYFRQICLLVIRRNKAIKFVAVIDNHGKLLFGHSSSKYSTTHAKRVNVVKSTKDVICCHEVENEAYQFFANCLVPVIKLNNNVAKHRSNKAQREFVPLYDVISPINRFVKIGITPLTESRNRFLCIYTDHQDTEIQILSP